MQDEVAIQQLLNRYTTAVCRREWDEVMHAFVPDAVWEVPKFGELEGHAAIRATMVRSVEAFAYFIQMNAPAHISLDGDTARTRSVIRECGKYADRDEALEAFGYYNDTVVRTPEGWKFSRRTFEVAGRHTFSLLPPS